jgi:hypothetical protein
LLSEGIQTEGEAMFRQGCLIGENARYQSGSGPPYVSGANTQLAEDQNPRFRAAVKEAQDAGQASRRPRKKTNTKRASNTVFMADASFEPART